MGWKKASTVGEWFGEVTVRRWHLTNKGEVKAETELARTVERLAVNSAAHESEG